MHPGRGYDPRVSQPSIVWFRDDLRLADNPALRAAIDRGEPVIGLYVLDEESRRHPPARRRRASGGCTAASQSLGERLRERGVDARAAARTGGIASCRRS